MIFALTIIDFEKALGLLRNKLADWFNLFVLNTPNIVVGVFVFVCCIFMAKYASKLVKKILDKSSINPGVSFLIERFTYMLVYFMGLFALLNLIGLDKTLTSLLAGAGIIGLALSFAFQNIAANFISGVLLGIRRPYHVGDIIESQKVRGKVIELSMHHTTVVNKTGQCVILPNKEIFEEPLLNYTRFGSREIELMVPIPLNSDLDHIRSIIGDALRKLPDVLPDQNVDVYFMRYDSYCIHTEVNYWVNYKEIKDFESSMSKGLEAVHKALKAHNIEIPMPRNHVVLEDVKAYSHSL